MGSWFKKHSSIVKVALAPVTGGLSLISGRTASKIPVVSSVDNFLRTPSSARTAVAVGTAAVATGLTVGALAGSGVGLAGSVAGGQSVSEQISMAPGTDLSATPGASDLVLPNSPAPVSTGSFDVTKQISNAVKSLFGGGSGGGGGSMPVASTDQASVMGIPANYIPLIALAIAAILLLRRK